MNSNRTSLPLHSLSITDTTEEHSVSSLGTPDSSDEDMSTSSEGSRYESSKLLRDIKEALDASKYPGLRHQQQNINTPARFRDTRVAETQAVYRREFNNINKWNHDDFFMMDERDEQLIQEQFRILQQIERDKALSKSTPQDPSPKTKDEDKKQLASSVLSEKLVSAKSEKFDYSDPKLREWEGKIVKLLDEQQSQAAIATGEALYIKCTGCSSMLGFPKESTHLYCPLCHTLHKLPSL